MITVKLHGRNGSRVIKIKPKGFGTRHVRAPREINPPVQPPAPAPETPVPVCPVLAALHKLTKHTHSVRRLLLTIYLSVLTILWDWCLMS